MLLLACRFCHGLRIPYLNMKRPIWLLTIDILSCIPAEEIFESVGGEGFGKPFEFIDYLKFVRISYYFNYHSQMISSEAQRFSVLYLLFSTLALSLFAICALELTNCFLLNSCTFATLALDISHSVSILTFRGLSDESKSLSILILAESLVVLFWFWFTLRRTALLITSTISSKDYESYTEQKLHSTLKQMQNFGVSKSLENIAVGFIRLD